MDIVLNMSDRGQITIPANIRKAWNTNKLTLKFKDQTAFISPLQTKEEFLKELDEIENDFHKNGGLSLEEIAQKYKL